MIDEINQELLKNVNKCEGYIINMFVRQDRIKSFETLWKNTFDEHYKDLDRKNMLKEIEAKRTKNKTSGGDSEHTADVKNETV